MGAQRHYIDCFSIVSCTNRKAKRVHGLKSASAQRHTLPNVLREAEKVLKEASLVYSSLSSLTSQVHHTPRVRMCHERLKCLAGNVFTSQGAETGQCKGYDT